MNPYHLTPEHAEIREADEEKVKRFKKALACLKERNKELSEKQRLLGLQRKPSKGAVNKSRRTAIVITTLLNLVRRVKKQPLVYVPTVTCRHCGHTKELPPRLVHDLPKSDDEMRIVAATETELMAEFSLGEFVKKMTGA